MALVATAPALAQERSGASTGTDGSDFGNAEIVVTARKQTESILEVPVTAAVLGSEDLSRNAINNISELGSQTPSVNLDQNSSGPGSFTIRGVGTSVLDSGIDQAVALVIDGIQTSRGNFIEVGLLDLERVEILKGPQALFFGKNSPGGVVALVSREPTDELSGYVRSGYEFRADEVFAEGAISGPLSESVGARLAVRGSDMDGWIRNVAQSTPNPFAGIPGNDAVIGPAPYHRNDSSNYSGRFTLAYDDDSAFDATLRVFGAIAKNRGSSANAEVVNCGGAARPDAFGIPDPFGDCQVDYRQSVGPTPAQIIRSEPQFDGPSPFADFKTYGGALTMNFDAGAVDFTSVTAYLGYDYLRVQNVPTVYAYNHLIQDEDFRQFSQELRGVTDFDGPLNFTGGVYFETNKQKQRTPNALFPTPADPATGSFITYIYNANNSGDSYSVFGQLRYELMETLELTAGGRFSHDVRDGELFNSFVNSIAAALLPLAAPGTRFKDRRKYDNFSPEVTLSWKPAPDTLVFGSYRTGYKAGGAGSPQILTAGFSTATDLFYAPEKIKGFEIGAKTVLLDNRLRLEASAYTYDYTNLQISNFDAAAFTLQPLGGDLKTEGFEVTGAFEPVEGLTLQGGVGYVKARYTDFPGVSCYTGQTAAEGCVTLPSGSRVQNLAGQQKFRAPDWTGNAGVVYETPLSEGLKIEAGASMSFASSYFTQENNSRFAREDGYTLLNASLRLSEADDRWQIGLIGRNLTDEKYVVSSLDMPNAAQPGTIYGVVSRARQIMVEGRIQF